MSTLNRDQVVEIAQSFSRGLQLEHIHKLALCPTCLNMTRKGKRRTLDSKSQRNAWRNQTFQNCQKCGKNHQERVMQSEGFLGMVSQVIGCRIDLLQVKDKEVTCLCLQLQQLQWVALVIKVLNLVEMVVSAITYCILFKLARKEKILLMLSLVCCKKILCTVTSTWYTLLFNSLYRIKILCQYRNYLRIFISLYSRL